MYKEIYFSEIDSTNKYLKIHENSLENFTFVRSDYQTLGKGRNERIWNSNKGDNLLFPLLIKDAHLVSKGGLLSLIASISIAQFLEQQNLKDIWVKWPNDVYVGDKKICGILLEGQVPNYVIIGIGLNVNQIDFIGEYRTTPTSIKKELGKNINIGSIKDEIYSLLINNLNNLETGFNGYLNYFNNHNYLNNKEVSFIKDNMKLVGKVIGIDENYNLIIESNNQKYRISSGEITIFNK